MDLCNAPNIFKDDLLHHTWCWGYSIYKVLEEVEQHRWVELI